MTPIDTKELQDLRIKLFDATMRKTAADNEVKYLQGKISEILADDAKQRFGDKLSGDITFENEAGKFKASIGKTVKWDSAKLQSIAANMPWPEVVSFFKIDFSVPESNYKSAQTLRPELAGLLDEARSTKYGELTIKPVYED